MASQILPAAKHDQDPPKTCDKRQIKHNINRHIHSRTESDMLVLYIIQGISELGEGICSSTCYNKTPIAVSLLVLTTKKDYI